MALNKEQILQTKPLLQEVEVPEWGGSVFIRPVTLREQGQLADLGTKYEKAPAIQRVTKCTMQLILWCVCDEEGNRLFSVTDDLEKLLEKSASAFSRLQDAILKLSGLTEESRAELEKNLVTAQTDKLAS